MGIIVFFVNKKTFHCIKRATFARLSKYQAGDMFVFVRIGSCVEFWQIRRRVPCLLGLVCERGRGVDWFLTWR
jgi:hypothetical protein